MATQEKVPESFVCAKCQKHGYVHIRQGCGFHFVSKEAGLNFALKHDALTEKLRLEIERSNLPEKEDDVDPFVRVQAKLFNDLKLKEEMIFDSSAPCLSITKPHEANLMPSGFRESLRVLLNSAMYGVTPDWGIETLPCPTVDKLSLRQLFENGARSFQSRLSCSPIYEKKELLRSMGIRLVIKAEETGKYMIARTACGKCYRITEEERDEDLNRMYTFFEAGDDAHALEKLALAEARAMRAEQ